MKKLTNRNGSRFVVEYVRNDGRLVENARENFLNVGVGVQEGQGDSDKSGQFRLKF